MAILGSALAIAVLAGMTGGLLSGLRPGDMAGLALALTSLTLLVSWKQARSYLAIAAVGAGAVAYGAAARDRAFAPELLRWLEAHETAAASTAPGVVMLEGQLAADAQETLSGVRLVVDVVRPATGRVQLHVAGSMARPAAIDWRAGRTIRAPVTLKRPQNLVNFGGPSPRWQALRRPFVLVGTIKSAALVETMRGNWPDEAAAGCRQFVRERIGETIGRLHPQAAALVIAVLIGDRAALDSELERRLQAAGTYHVIAISGGNVALLVALCVGTLRWLSRSYRTLAWLSIVAVAGYGWIVSGEPSVARAIIVAMLYLASTLIGLVARPLAILRTAAVLIALIQPLDVLDAGAWLSFGGTFGIIAMAPRLVDWARRAAGQQWSIVPRAGLMMVAATIGAELVLMPIGASVFGRISVAGVALNLVAIPAMAILQLAGIALLVFGTLATVPTALLMSAAAIAADVLTGSSALVDVWPWLSWRVPPVPLGWIAAYYGSLFAALVTAARWPKRVACTTVAISGLVVATSPFVQASAPRDGRLRITILDVGQGDAVLVQTPSHQSLLIDTGGSSSGFDIGSRVVAPAAWALGVRRLNWLALTHGDRDHAGGAASVTRDLAPIEVWEGIEVPRDADRAALRDLAASAGMPWRTITAGARIEIGSVQIESIHPPVPEWERQKVRNDDSIVLRVRFGRVEMWLTGDAGAEFEARLPPVPQSAAIRILKVGHHGSRSSTSAALVQALQPQIAVVSVGAGNLFGHPAPSVLERLTVAGTAVFRTDRDGAVAIETDGETVYVQAASGRTWTVSRPDPATSLRPARRPRAP